MNSFNLLDYLDNITSSNCSLNIHCLISIMSYIYLASLWNFIISLNCFHFGILFTFFSHNRVRCSDIFPYLQKNVSCSQNMSITDLLGKIGLALK